MKTRHNELAVGIAVTTATLIVVFGILALGSSGLFLNGPRLRMVVPDAGGLAVGDSVLLRGISIGTVDSLELRPKGVVIAMSLKENPGIPVDSEFFIKSSSLLGDKAVEIVPGTSSRMLSANAEVRGAVEEGLAGLAGSAGEVKRQISTILTNINNLSGEATLRSLYGTIDNLNNTIATLQGILAENRVALKTTIDNLSAMSTENKKPVTETIQSLNTTIQSIDLTSVKLRQAIDESNTSLSSLSAVLADVEAGRGTLGKLVKDDSLYEEMKSAVTQFKALVEDIKKNPQKYVTVKLF